MLALRNVASAVCLGDLIEGDPLGDARPDGASCQQAEGPLQVAPIRCALSDCVPRVPGSFSMRPRSSVTRTYTTETEQAGCAVLAQCIRRDEAPAMLCPKWWIEPGLRTHSFLLIHPADGRIAPLGIRFIGFGRRLVLNVSCR